MIKEMTNLIKWFRALPEERKEKIKKAGLIFGVLSWVFVYFYAEFSKLDEQFQYIKEHHEIRIKTISKDRHYSGSLTSLAHMMAFVCVMFFIVRLETTRKRGEHLLFDKPKTLTTFTVHASREVAMNDVITIAQQLRLRIECLDLDKGIVILGDDRHAWIDWGWYLAVYIEDAQAGTAIVSIGAENKVKKRTAHVGAKEAQQEFLEEVRSYFISKERKIA